jgi:hypothetical protein
MEISTLFIAVVFMIPFALGLILLGAMAADDLPAGTVSKKKPTKSTAKKARNTGNIGPYLPA